VARRLSPWLLATALAAPLVGLTVWVIHGAVRPAAGVSASRPPAGVLAGLPVPAADLPADRLEERVDGGADALRADGCRRLLHWRLDRPPADAEVLVFRSEGGARTVMAREAGPERTPGPGEEAQATAQAVYFRRGPVLVRLFLDPGATPPPDSLLRRAEEIDRALSSGARL
jgi:hypothetical protein